MAHPERTQQSEPRPAETIVDGVYTFPEDLDVSDHGIDPAQTNPFLLKDTSRHERRVQSANRKQTRTSNAFTYADTNVIPKTTRLVGDFYESRPVVLPSRIERRRKEPTISGASNGQYWEVLTEIEREEVYIPERDHSFQSDETDSGKQSGEPMSKGIRGNANTEPRQEAIRAGDYVFDAQKLREQRAREIAQKAEEAARLKAQRKEAAERALESSLTREYRFGNPYRFGRDIRDN